VMKKLIKRQKGFTLIELLIVLAVLGILAAVVIPNVTGFLSRGKERAWSTDRQVLQTAVDAWRSDVGARSGNPWPILAGDASCLQNTPNVVPGTCNTYIDIGALATDNYLKGADAVKSADTTQNTSATNNPSGSYGWFLTDQGVVESCITTVGTGACDTPANGRGFQDGIYP